MAKTTVIHACGHQATHNLLGAEQDRRGRAAWLAERDCNDCFRAARAEAERATTAAVTAELALPALTGSDKQVGWAGKIRAAKLQAVREMIGDVQQLATATMRKPALADALTVLGGKHDRDLDATRAAIVAELAGRAAAKWWIDHRDLDTLDLVLLATAAAAA